MLGGNIVSIFLTLSDTNRVGIRLFVAALYLTLSNSVWTKVILSLPEGFPLTVNVTCILVCQSVLTVEFV